MIAKTLGHYQIIEKLGTGGMGEVYRAYYEHLQRDVAARVLPSGTLADDAARKEALALSRLNHPKYRDGARLRHSGCLTRLYWNREQPNQSVRCRQNLGRSAARSRRYRTLALCKCADIRVPLRCQVLPAQARHIFRDIVDMPADVRITENEVEVSYHRRSHLPILLASGLMEQRLPVPWWGGLPLRLTDYHGPSGPPNP